MANLEARSFSHHGRSISDSDAQRPVSDVGQSSGHGALSPSRHQLASDMMLEQGYCPCQVQHLSRSFDTETFTYLSRIGRSPMRQESHAECTTEGCIAYNVDMEDYNTKHVSPDCDCNMISVSTEVLLRIIRRGAVPLVTVEILASSEVFLKLHERTMQSEYTAISHVWYDGLGNPASNALPECQARRFQSLVSSTPDVCASVVLT